MIFFQKNRKHLIYSGIYSSIIVAIFALWYIFKGHNVMDEGSTIPFVLFVITFVLVAILITIQSLFSISGKAILPEYYFVAAMLIWGVIYMLILPPFSAPDEITHFASANKLANIMMNQVDVDDRQRVLVREIDNKEYEKNPTEKSIVEFYEQFQVKNENREIDTAIESEGGEGTRSFFLNYLPQAIGIVIARIFNLNYVFLSLMGRLLNLLCYVVVVYWAIKIIPFAKWPLYIITQFPMVLELAASYSYDTLAIALTFLFIAYCMKCIYEKEKVSNKNLFFLLILGMLMSPIKAVYGFVTLLVVMIPGKKMPGKKLYMSLLYKVGIVFLCLVSVITVNMTTVKRTISYTTEPTASIEKTQSNTESEEKTAIATKYYSFQKIVEEPRLLFDLGINTIKERGWSYIATMVGGLLGWMSIRIHVSIVWLFLGLVALALFVEKNKLRYEISHKDRMWSFAILFAVFMAFHFIMLVSHTEYNASLINGVQGRYFIPTLPIVFIMCYINSTRSKLVLKPIIWIYACNLLNMLTILQVFVAIYQN